jgi:predicted MFS family arabinose efflux permease
MLRHSAGFGSLGITAALFAYGFGGVVGNFYAGKVPFHLLTRSMSGAMIALMQSLRPSLLSADTLPAPSS